MTVKAWHKFYDQDYTFRSFIKNIHGHIDFFEEILAEKPKTILEIGSGTGQMATFLSYLGYQVTSVDNDPGVLKRAEALSKEFGGSAKFQLADAFKLPFQDQEFDVIFHQGLLEHFEDKDIRALLDEELRVGKTVVFSVPNNFYPQKDYGNERLLTKEAWEEVLGKYSLKTSRNYFEHQEAKCYFLFKWKIKCRVKSFQVMYLGKLSKK